MSRNELIKLTSEIPVGGSEDETKEAVKKLFRKSFDQYKNLTKEDIDYLDKEYLDNEAINVFCIAS